MNEHPEHILPAVELPHVPIPDGYRLRDVQFEVSLKPFFDTSPETRAAVCAEIFHQWQALWRHAETISILLWIAEGSEILEYGGDPTTTFEWARYQGAPNRHRWEMPTSAQPTDNPDHAGIGINTMARDPDEKGLHNRAYLYRENPATFTFEWLLGLVRDLKRIGAAITGRRILVGDAFDIGPEFAVSRFKYDWHREILSDGPVFKEQFVSCEATLKADNRRYAGYPNGIPDGLRMGAFLGRQANCFLTDMGMDFLWLSNGFGFALEPWAMVGQVFDGSAFRSERAGPTAERVLRFWRDLRQELPMAIAIRTRGTNLATGIDLGSDASPLKAIYEGGFGLDAPVNSPWAAIDGDFGLELTGWMSHLVRHPGDTFRYRFYSHDPWWANSPWLDRYGRQPHDIFLPLAVSYVQESGAVEIPRDFALLSIDDSHGGMPRSVPNEVIAHMLRAREFAPDAAGPFIWAYPFDGFHDLALKRGRPEIPFHADAYMGTVVNEGVPINTVADLAALQRIAETNPEFGNGRVVFLPVPLPGSTEEAALETMLNAGWSVLAFGPIEPGSVLLRTLGLGLTDPIEGDFMLEFPREAGSDPGDTRSLRHTALLSAGGMREITAGSNGPEGLFVHAISKLGRRVVAASAQSASGKWISWVRGSLTTAEWNPDAPSPIRGPILRPLDPNAFCAPGYLVRRMLFRHGWVIRGDLADRELRMPCHTVHRCCNAFIYSGYQRNALSVLWLRHPLGAPLCIGRQHRLRDGCTEITGEIAWHAEVRVFADQQKDGAVACRNLQPGMYGVNRRILASGLQNADVWVFPDPEYSNSLKLLRDPKFPYFTGAFVEPVIETTPWGPAVHVRNVSGELLIEY